MSKCACDTPETMQLWINNFEFQHFSYTTVRLCHLSVPCLITLANSAIYWEQVTSPQLFMLSVCESTENWRLLKREPGGLSEWMVGLRWLFPQHLSSIYCMTTGLGLYMVESWRAADTSGLLSCSGISRALNLFSLYLRDHLTVVFLNQFSRVLFNQSHTYFDFFLVHFFFSFHFECQ